MAELRSDTDCCSPEARAECCERADKDACCGEARCGCEAGVRPDDLREPARARLEGAPAEAGLVDVEIRQTHRVHEHAGAAIIHAIEPGQR
jgi:hypothetical protein